MQTLKFKNGDTLPMIGLGTWKSAPGEVGAAVKAAIAAGYRHIDCAAIYQNEAEIGQALRECFAAGWVKREELWITSKLWNDSHAQDQVRPAIERTLNALQLDYLDLYLIHWPVCIQPGLWLPRSGADFVSLTEIPLTETWSGMEALVTAGLSRHIGVSNFSIAKLELLRQAAIIAPEMNQIELHPHLQQPQMLDYCQAHGIHVTAYSPLGSGDRAEAFKAPNEPVLLENPTLVTIANRHHCSPAQVLIAWAIARHTAVIPKSVNPDRIAQNLAAQDLQLSATDLAELASLDQHYRYVDGSFWAMPGSPYTIASLWDEASAG